MPVTISHALISQNFSVFFFPWTKTVSDMASEESIRQNEELSAVCIQFSALSNDVIPILGR